MPDLKLFTPSYPYVIVERLPRVRKEGEIVLTDDASKPLHEGVVLRTWAPWNKIIETRSQFATERMASVWKPGDHVLFPHWAGVEDPGQKDILFIREHGDVQSGGGIIIGRVNHDEKSIRKELTTYLAEIDSDYEAIVQKLLRDFIIVPRFSVTGSGESYEEPIS